MFEHKLLRNAVDTGFDEADAFALAVAISTNGHKAQATRPRRLDHLRRAIMIGRDHRRAARRYQIAEQAELRIEIMRNIRMIIHVVAREVGEAAGRDAHAVEAILIESVR